MKVALRRIRSGYEGFSSLIQLHTQIGEVAGQRIDIEMNQCDWIDANMCAPLGAILYKASRKLNRVALFNIAEPVEKILSKNGFLSHYGQEMITDTYGTTVEYKRFEPKDDRYFSDYIEKRLIGKGIPLMSLELLKDSNGL